MATKRREGNGPPNPLYMLRQVSKVRQVHLSASSSFETSFILLDVNLVPDRAIRHTRCCNSSSLGYIPRLPHMLGCVRHSSIEPVVLLSLLLLVSHSRRILPCDLIQHLKQAAFPWHFRSNDHLLGAGEMLSARARL
jgi:hypothetical protein